MASSSTPRPYNAIFLAVFAALSATGLWAMRIAPALHKFPVGLYELLAAGVLPNGHPIKKFYTGVRPVDEVLSLLVTVFIYGPTGWNEPFYWQQLHFLMQITPVVAIMNVEACRERNRGSWLKFTALYAFLYQNIGGAVIVPLWWLALHRRSGQKSYFASGRAVPVPYASIILPATVLLFAIPATAIYVPGWDTLTLQNILAFWQWTPVLVNVPLWFASPFVSSSPAGASDKTSRNDLAYLKLIYGTTFVIGAAAHWFTMFGIWTSTNPDVSFSSVFLPTSLWNTTIDYGVLYLFQWDWIVCATTLILSSWIAVYDVQRQLHGAASSMSLITGAGALAALTLVGGPSGAMAAVWNWREDKLVLIEERSSSGKKK